MKTAYLHLLAVCILGITFFSAKEVIATESNEPEIAIGNNTFASDFKMAEKGDTEAQFKVGYAYLKGEEIKKDDAQAVKWFRKAAEQNHPGAQYILGVMYDEGHGIPRDREEGVKWIRKAAEQNHAFAQQKLGVMCHFGMGAYSDGIRHLIPTEDAT